MARHLRTQKLTALITKSFDWTAPRLGYAQHNSYFPKQQRPFDLSDGKMLRFL
jgi:hypothetical protein